MAALNDLLVSYKQVEVPESQVTIDTPLDRYDRLLQYVNTRDTQTTEPVNPAEQPDDFKWYYSGSPQTTSQTTSQSIPASTPVNNGAPSQPNNTPIMSKNTWVTQLSEAYRKLGVSENGIRNLIAKNALESGWGKSAQGKYNYGNITTGASWKGAYVNGRDHDANGNPVRHNFRSYNSMEEFAADEVNFLKRLYDFDDKDDIDTFTYKLKGGNKGKRNYAEDRNYAAKVKSVYQKI